MFDETGEGLCEAIAAQERLISAATARQAQLIAALAARRRGAEAEFVADELAMLLQLTRRGAEGKLEFAQTLMGRPAVWQALLAGRIDVNRARVLLDELANVRARVRDRIEAEGLGYAPGHTRGQLRAFLQRRVTRADSGAADRRRAAAITERRVTYTPLADGMAELHAVLPAEQARAVYEQLTALAAHASRGGAAGGRGYDQLRADGLVALCTGSFTELRLPVPAWLGQDLPPGVDVLGRRVELQVLVPLSALLGADDTPAQLAGHGPIPASLLAELAHGRHTTWRRILTDTAGAVVRVDSSRYRPPPALARFVAVRDGTCTAPGCRHPASWADLDHVIAWPRGSTTGENLQALCRHHHRLKHTGRWQVLRADDGTTTWVTPTGRRYTNRPDGAAGAASDDGGGGGGGHIAPIRPLPDEGEAAG